MLSVRETAAEVKGGQPFKFLSMQTYAGILVVIVFLVSNNRSLMCQWSASCRYSNALADYVVWGCLTLIALLLLARFGKIHAFILAWRRNALLALFILYSIASISWSIVPERSFHTVFIMLAASFTAAVLAMIFPPQTILKILFFILLASAVCSLLTVILYPRQGIHQDALWFGAWKGIFEHKNDFGPLMALGNGLALLFSLSASNRSSRIIYAFAYILTLFLSVMSRSATAVVLCAILNGLVLLYFVWTRWGAKWRGRGMLIVVILTASLAVTFLISSIFMVMGKNIKLTGRVPLWTNLLENVVSKKPWFGYGLETVWYFPEFQKWAAISSGWGTRIVVINGHNGYMDILIYLGVFGLILLCLFLGQGLAGAARRALDSRTWLDFSPLLIFIYILVANLAIDFMVEFESFHWIILVVLLFLPPGRLADKEITAIRND